MRSPAPQRPTGATGYPRLDLTGVRLPSTVLTGTHGRADILCTARGLGYPARTVTPALTRFSRIYVVQLGGDPDEGTVTLATGDGQTVTVKLPVDFRYRIVPQTKVETMLAAVEADYPPSSLAEALSAVLHVCDRQRATGHATVPLHVVSEALAAPLRALLDPWTDDTSTPAAARATS